MFGQLTGGTTHRGASERTVVSAIGGVHVDVFRHDDTVLVSDARAVKTFPRSVEAGPPEGQKTLRGTCVLTVWSRRPSRKPGHAPICFRFVALTSAFRSETGIFTHHYVCGVRRRRAQTQGSLGVFHRTQVCAESA